MATEAAIKRIQVWVWVLIYGGLLTFILGISSPAPMLPWPACWGWSAWWRWWWAWC